MTPGRKFSISTSEAAASASAWRWPDADLRSSTCVAARPRSRYALPGSLNLGPFGGSILVTSAPASASRVAAIGPATYWPKSSTRTPSSGPVEPCAVIGTRSSSPGWLEAGQRLQRLAGRAHPLDRVLVRGQRRLREPAAVQARVGGHLAQPRLALIGRAEQLEPVDEVLLDVRVVVEQVAVGVPCADPVVGEVVAGQPLPQDRLPGLGHALVLEGGAEP